jgi:CheY-like chemotaxis protein
MPTALIVDDEPEANRLLSMLVRLRGYETLSAFSGEEALRAVRARHPDVVFLDLMLPDRHGFEVCRSLRSDPSTTLVPVVVVTARLADRSRAESYEAGATDFVPKPYTPDQIFKALGSAAAWHRNLSQTPGEGRIVCKAADRFLLDRQLTGLKSLLLARAPLNAQDVDQITQAVRTLCASASAWGRGHGADQVACVQYRLDADRLSLRILDEAGWLESTGASVPVGVVSPLFDDVEAPESGRSLVLTRRFGSEGPEPS